MLYRNIINFLVKIFFDYDVFTKPDDVILFRVKREKVLVKRVKSFLKNQGFDS